MGSLNKNIWWCFVKFFLGSLYRSIILRNTSIQNQKLYQTQWFKDTLIDKIVKMGCLGKNMYKLHNKVFNWDLISKRYLLFQ